MDFRLSDDQTALVETVRTFAERELVDQAAVWDREDRLPEQHIIDTMVQMGLYGICLPTEYGGGGQDLLTALLCIETLAEASPLVAAGVFESNVGPVQVISQFGSDEQKAHWIPKVCAGEAQISIGMTEPESGSALTDLKTRADKVDGGYKLNGRKIFCSGGGHSEAYLVYCRLDPDQLGAKGIGGIIVEKGTAGFTFGKQEQFMGMRGMPSSDLVFDDCVVPEENLVIAAGDFAKLMSCFDTERCGNATMALGIAAGALGVAVEYANERHTFGKPIADRQAIQMMVADMAIRVDASRLMIHRAAVNAADGHPTIHEASMAKVFANETAKAVTDMAMEILGGYGYSTEFPIERMLRDSRGWPLAGGTLQIQKIIIAAAVLGRRFNQRI
ncbi:MAG: acyl-CoA dehydrogenase family protein [Acidimicrobiales bacterium]